MRSGARSGRAEKAGGGGIVDQVAVDLVGDDRQIELAGHLDDPPDGVRGGQRSAGVVGQRDQQRAHLTSPGPRAQDRGHDVLGIRHPSLAGGRRNEQGTRPDQVGLGGVADPARHRQHDVAADREQQAVQQCFAPGAADHQLGVGGKPSPVPVSGGRLAQSARAGDRPVSVVLGRRDQPFAQGRMNGQTRLSEGQVQHALTGTPSSFDLLVRRQGGGQGHVHRGSFPIGAERFQPDGV